MSIHNFKPNDRVTVTWMDKSEAGIARAVAEGSITIDFGGLRCVGFWWTGKRWESTGDWPATLKASPTETAT
jgi:hypothetical protein